MKSFAFIISPTKPDQIKKLLWLLAPLPDIFIGAVFKRISPFKLKRIKFNSPSGKQVEGFIILCPLLPRLMPQPESDLALENIMAAAEFASKFGVKIIGFSGLGARLVNKNSELILKRVKTPLTCGNALSAWSVFEAIYRISKVRKLDLRKLSVAIIGATDSTGNLCAKMLSGYVAKLILNANSKAKLEQLKDGIAEKPSAEIIIDTDINSAVRDSDIIINLNGALDNSFDPGSVNKRSIFCSNYTSGEYPEQAIHSLNVPIIRTGVIKVPFLKNPGFYTSLSDYTVGASFAETMLLALEGRLTSYSLGENINLDKAEEIADLAVRNDFEVWLPEAPVL